MQKPELVFAAIIALGGTCLSFVLYLWLFDIGTGRLRDRTRTTFQRLGRAAPKVLLALAVATVVGAVLYLVVAYRGVWSRFVGNTANGALAVVRSITTRRPGMVIPPKGEGSPLPTRPEDAIPMVADHRIATLAMLDAIPRDVIRRAADDLRVLCLYPLGDLDLRDGIGGLAAYRGSLFDGLAVDWAPYDPQEIPLDAADLSTRLADYLKARPETNVVLWLWGETLADGTDRALQTYLDAMGSFEARYPRVRFVYATGSVDGGDVHGLAAVRNERIRRHCSAGARALYDAADMESHDPDGNDFSDRFVTRLGWYDSDGNKTRDRNWAADWQSAHPGEWYWCGPGSAQPVIANVKAYAAWWLLARLSGWDGRRG